MRIDPKRVKNLKTRIQMSRCYGHADFFKLTVEDDLSGRLILEVELEPSAIADLISSRNTQPMPTKYYADPNIGLKHENKEFAVDLSKLPGLLESYDAEKRDRDLKHVCDLAEELNPGWTVDRNEYSSNRKVGGYYHVILRRYVSQE